MEPFKNLLNPALVAAAGQQLQGAHPAFDANTFTRLASNQLQTMELKARALHICAALQATLPADFDTAASVVENALAPAEPGTQMGDNKAVDIKIASLSGVESGLRGWILWPVGEWVAQQGLKHPQRALKVLHALTQRFTAEFAIRPFIVAHPTLAYQTLASWTQDPSAHVRRLVSEGSRPRLPWGLRLQSLVADPSPSWPLLLALQDDPSDYVRRSVANHLNDIAKDHPGRVAQWLQTHLPNASPQRTALLRHASRSLIKAGHPATLKAWGLGNALKGTVQFSGGPAKLKLGGASSLTVHLQSTSAKPQILVVDYAVWHVKANRSTSAKVFKGWKLTLPAHGHVRLEKRHAIKAITTRKYYPGWHAVQLQINGKVVAESGFELTV